MSETKPIDISSKLFLNVKESCLTSGSAALENAYQNEIGGISRFPGLSEFSTLFGTQPTYLHEWNGLAQGPATVAVPQAQAAVPPGGDDAPAIRAECHARDRALAAGDGLAQGPATLAVPQSQSAHTFQILPG